MQSRTLPETLRYRKIETLASRTYRPTYEFKKKTEKEISTSYRKEKLPLFVSTQQVFVNVESLRDNLILIPGRIFGRCIQRYFYLSSVNLYTWVFILSLLLFFGTFKCNTMTLEHTNLIFWVRRHILEIILSKNETYKTKRASGVQNVNLEFYDDFIYKY